MNWLLAIVIAILIIYAWRGKERGFIRTVFAFFSTIIAIAITLWISPYVSKWIQENDKIVEYVNESVNETFLSDKQDIGNNTTEQVEFIEEMSLPLLMKETLIKNNTSDVYNVIAASSFNDYVTNLISMFLINVGTFMVITIIVKIMLYIIGSSLDMIGRLPILNGLNRVAGLLAGLVQGIVIVWIGFIVITLFMNNEYGQSLMAQINKSQILSTIYNNNLILVLLTDTSKVLF